MRNKTQQQSLWGSVPRKLIESMDAAAFKKLSELIHCGSDSDVREMIEEQERLRCLRFLKRSVRKTKANLRTNNRGALASRKREFEQAAILLE